MIPAVEKVLFVAFLVMVVGAVALKLYSLRKGHDKFLRKAMTRTAYATFWLGVFGLYLSAVNYERIYLLSSRFWYLVWLALFGIAAYRILKYVLKEIPAIHAKEAEREQANKWLPKTK